jgi:hypothetical protein
MPSSPSRLPGFTLRRRRVALQDPVGHFGAAGIFLLGIHSHAQASRVSCIQRRAICYLGDRITCVADVRRFGGAERMVPVATRKRFMGGDDVVQPTR